MEQGREQLDYGETELKKALKKAQAFKSLGPRERDHKSANREAFLFDASKEARTNVSSTCYINPKFAKQDIVREVPNSNTFLFAPSYNTFYQHPLQNSWATSQYPSFAPCRTAFHPAISSNFFNPSVFSSSQNQPYLQSSQHLRPQSLKSCQNWDLMVDDFVRKTISARSCLKNRSSSSSSSSYLPRRSRSNTRSYSRESCNTSPPTQKRHSNLHRKRELRTRPKKTQVSKQTIECAKAIGLGSEYLKKIEEQNKLREEIARKKNQHRKEICARESRVVDQKNEAKPQAKPHQNEGTSRQKVATNRLRPYLAVVVTNIYGLDDPCRKVALIANKIGPIKKVWQESEASVHLIFEKHEDAKKFMQQYIGDSTAFDRVIDVTMKKVFLNTAAIL